MKPRRLLPLLAMLPLLAALCARPAGAQPPVRLSDDMLTDQAGVIEDEQRVEDALIRLRDRKQVQLFVVYVDSFDGEPASQWAEATAHSNGLGDDDILLAVAVRDRQYAWNVSQGFPMGDDRLRTWAAEDIEPRLQREDWTGAAIGAARGLETRLDGWLGGVGLWGVVLAALPCVALLILGVALVFVMRAVRTRREETASPVPAGAPAPEAMSTRKLSRTASALLVEMDDALETSEQDVGFAEAEFGAEAARPFREALERARSDVGEAFRLQQQLSDAQPESDAERRRILTEIVRRAERADDELEAYAARFERLRARAKRGPEIAVAVEEAVEATGERVGQAEATLASLRDAYPESALAPVEGAPERARERLRFASDSVAKAREDLPEGDRGKAAALLSASEEAASQASQLLDAVGKTAADLEAAKARLETGLADLRQDIAAAEALPPGESAALTAYLGAARAARAEIEQATSAGRYDPLAMLHRLETAAVPLDTALVRIEQREEQEAHARQRLDETIAATRGRLDAVHRFIATNRGGVGTQARAALAEAQARLAQAEALRESDALTALGHAEAAAAYAERALALAQDDVDEFGGDVTDDLGRMILGGILLGQLGGGFGGGWGGHGGRRGGFGGWSPGSFGGSASRRGGGGRF